MRKDLTDITLIVDRSGSMESIRPEAEAGVNAFINKQKNEPNSANLTIVQFDTEYEFICNGMDIKSAPTFTLQPRGCTALMDAVGRAIKEAGIRLDAMTEDNKPGLVIFVICTDGQENSSHEFTRQQVKDMLEHQKTKYGWQFIFLGTDEKGWEDARDAGVNTSGGIVLPPKKFAAGLMAASESVSQCRSCCSSGEQVNAVFTEEQRQRLS